MRCSPTYPGRWSTSTTTCLTEGFQGERLSGVFDWDLAGPTTPLLELALAAWNGVPLFRDVAAAYGGPSALEILHAVPGRIQTMLAGVPARAAARTAGRTRPVGSGFLDPP